MRIGPTQDPKRKINDAPLGVTNVKGHILFPSETVKTEENEKQ